MAINLSNFVDIKINYHLTTSSSATRDTAVLIIGTNGDRYEDTIDNLSDFSKLFGKEVPLYYYGYCFFTNGGKKLRLIERPLTQQLELTQNNERLGFTSSAYYLSENVPATPQNSNNGDALYEEKYTLTEDEEPVEGKTYYKQENIGGEIRYVRVTSPVTSEMGTYYELSYVLVQASETAFIRNKYYYLDSEGNIATPFICTLYEYQTLPLSAEDIVEEVTNLDNEYIIITSNVSYEIMKAANDIYNKEDKSINSKLFLSSLTKTEYEANEKKSEEEKFAYSSLRDGFVLKLNGTKITRDKDGIITEEEEAHGAEMAIAAYLTQINVNRFNSVKDYEFTIENVVYSYEIPSSADNLTVTISSVFEDNALVEALIKKNINVDSTLVNQVRNLGGNDLNGNDLVNEFMLIVLHQTLTERLVQLLTQKIKYNQTGLSLIGATIASELQRYVDNGYLTTDKAWTDPDLVYEGITIIKQNTPLQIGYKYVIFPFSSLSNDERAEHKLPPIYVLIADSYSIRKIEINGEVF